MGTSTSKSTTKIKKMRILFSCLVIFTSALNLTPRDFATFDEKLRLYQNMTGIDEATFNEIWEAGITNVQNYLFEAETNPQGIVTRHGSSQLIMARYGLSTVPTTILSPVIFNHRYFNLGMRYNNGIFIIDYPGYYRIDIKSYCHEGKTDNKFVGFYLMINSKRELEQFSRWAAPSQASGIF